MKTWISTWAAIGIVGSLAVMDADAHGHYGRPHVAVGIGIGIGSGYGYAYPWPYRHYYPGAYVGVASRPQYRARRVRSSESGEVALKQLYVYPGAGQSQRQLADDRYACHVWSVDRTGFDPTLGAGDRRQADEYGRALTACLEARNYVVR